MSKINFFSVMCLLALFVFSLAGCKKENVDNNSDQVIKNAVTDIDGNSYDAIQLGNQVWMAENLRTTKYADGTTIPMGSTYSYTDSYRYAPGSGQSNEENMDNVSRYGYLYNWPAVMHGASSSEANPSGVQGICPNGWHVPSDAEWTQLTDYMATQSIYWASGNADHLAKALAATWGWNSSSETDAPGNNPSTNNATGFSALPSGSYSHTPYSSFFTDFGGYTNFWGSTDVSEGTAYSVYINFHSADVGISNPDKSFAYSVRCLRD